MLAGNLEPSSCRHAPSADTKSANSGSARGWDPNSTPFPPPPPPRLAPPCSAASSALCRRATPLGRTCPACGYSPSRTGPHLSRTPQRSPGSRAYCCAACQGSSTTPGPASARELAPRVGVAFPQTEQGRHPDLCFRSSIPCPPVPLSTLRLPPHDDRRKTRGQDGIAFPFL